MFDFSFLRKRLPELPSQEEFNNINIYNGQHLLFNHKPGQDLESFLNLFRNRSNYGDFELTEALRPVNDPRQPYPGIVPIEAYRVTQYEEGTKIIPCIQLAVSAPRLMELYLTLLEKVGKRLDIYTNENCLSFESDSGLCSDGLDRVCLQSRLYDIEELLLHDGYFGIAAYRAKGEREVQLTRDKNVLVYAANLTPFISVIESFGIQRNDNVRFVVEGPHFRNALENRQEFLYKFNAIMGLDEAEHWENQSFFDP